jgi:hypothetical protein
MTPYTLVGGYQHSEEPAAAMFWLEMYVFIFYTDSKITSLEEP